MSIRRYCAVVWLTIVALYGVLLGFSYVAFPYHNRSELDTAQAKSTLFNTEPKYLLFNAHALAKPGKRLILIGASNVREGLRPAQLKDRLGAVGAIEIDNMALSSATILDTAQVVDLAYAEIPQQSWPETTFVVGIWYGEFLEASARPLDVERLRYGLYRLNSSGEIEPRFSKPWMRFFGEALRPALLASYCQSRALALGVRLRSEFLRLAGMPSSNLLVMNPETAGVTPAERQAWLQFLREHLGPFTRPGDETGLPGLVELARKISGRGSRLVILDLPLPRWHEDAMPQFAEYERRKLAFLRQAQALPGVTYASIQSGFPDDEFSDFAHPRPRITARWAERAAPAILANFTNANSAKKSLVRAEVATN